MEEKKNETLVAENAPKNVVTNTEHPTPKKRGRPPKKRQEEIVEDTNNKVSVETAQIAEITKDASEEKPKKRRGRPPKSESEKKTEKAKKSPFIESALFCDNFNPETIIQISNIMYDPLILEGEECFAILEEAAYAVFVPKVYIDADGYRKWFRHAYPEGSIVEEYIKNVVLYGSLDDCEHHNDEGYVLSEKEKGLKRHNYVEAKITLHRGGNYMPVSTIGLSAVNSYGKGKSFANYAKSEALTKAMRSIGFGDGLNWDYLRMQLPTFISLDDSGFINYNGPITSSSGKIVKEGIISADEFIENFISSEVRREKQGLISPSDNTENFSETSKSESNQHSVSSLKLIECYNNTLKG